MYKILIFYCFLQIASINANCGWKEDAYSKVLLDFLKIDEEDTRNFQGIQITSNDLDIKDYLFNDKCNIIEGSNIKFTLTLTKHVSSEKITEIFTVTYTNPTNLNLTKTGDCTTSFLSFNYPIKLLYSLFSTLRRNKYTTEYSAYVKL